MRKIVFIIIVLLFFSNLIYGQVKKSPLKASVLSFLLPGGGQFYNGSYLKFGFVCALESGLIGLASYHHWKSEDSYKKFEQTDNADYYYDYIDNYNKRQSEIFWIGTVVFLSMIDAFVDAHLFDFDEKKEKIRLKFEENKLLLSVGFW
ncbi:MAG: hypothetical protein H8E57_10365 [Candidatus Cloacimonetes bacterium]|nr:hypothetical protein [Candidatus Cloacimonadota bacterium]